MTGFRKYLYVLVVFLLVMLLLLLVGKTGHVYERTPVLIKDTLHFVIGENRGDYFIRRAEPVGYQLEMIRAFVKIHHARYRITILSSLEERSRALLDGHADIMVCARNEYAYHDADDDLTAAFLLPDSSAWVVRTKDAEMVHVLCQWIEQFRQTRDYRLTRQRYAHFQSQVTVNARSRYSSLSPYDNMIKQHAKQLGWDWCLLAALICQESRFHPGLESPRGAYGLMQVMPATAKYFGVDSIEDPVNNMKAGIKMLLYSKKYLQLDSLDEVNRYKFMLAAYNAGCGRINDCRTFAASQGKNPDDWDEVAEIIPLMRHEVHYSGEVVQLGRFKGTETLNYVREVWERYENYRNLVDD